MKRRLFISLGLLFILFSTGVGITVYYIYKTTTDLETVISLHRVEIIRQNLVINTQTVQTHLYTIGTAFGSELDVIVEHVSDLDRSVQSCKSCHHSKYLTEKLNSLSDMVEQYKDALSALITTTANRERIERLRLVAITLGNTLLSMVQEMAFTADQRLYTKTVTALKEINNSRIILFVTLSLAFIAALIVALIFTGQITKSIRILINATKELKSGRLGVTASYPYKDEFRDLSDAFNDMSITLKKNHDELLGFTKRLSHLYRATIPLYALTEEGMPYSELTEIVKELFDANDCKIFVRQGDGFVNISNHEMRIKEKEMEALYLYYKKEPAIYTVTSAPSIKGNFFDNLHEPALLIWIKEQEKLSGLLLVLNKKNGIFDQTDINIAAILSNIISVSFINVKLMENLRTQMRELQQTQEQLIQAAKLAALGEMASNIAHELNNPLTSIIGFSELSQEETDIETIKKDLKIIEQESLRAKEIVNQLLEFARKRSINIEEVNLNLLLQEVLKLASLQLKHSNINVIEDFGQIPTIQGDHNQLKQVFLNLINNAIHAMPDGGTLTIRTGLLDKENVYIDVEDTGHGITPEILPRIFEPFFTTKKEKGTGLGLSISYKIIDSHGGWIDVKSEVNKGTKFSVFLPVRQFSSQVSHQQSQDQLL
ncbi:MAG: ATP-binding protein [Thermodesulfovibrionales bacterium]|nr:ATP-binding protein [Thermodesulfovibrionales bacterium]